MTCYGLLRPLIFKLPEEKAHHLAISALKHGLVPRSHHLDLPRLRTQLWGLDFDNPIGVAPGFDKNAEVIAPLVKQGYGFVEVGTVTPQPQPGNPVPRLFRLPKDEAIINRLGFNNDGMEVYAERLRQWQDSGQNGIVGANIGRNKTSPNTPDDYVTLIHKIYGLSDYITVNISSPNTPNLREMQKDDALEALLKAVMDAKAERKKATGRDIPILLKVAPDMEMPQREAVADIVLRHKVDGLIVSNTTVGERDYLHHQEFAQEQGGLSGKPLFELSTAALADMYWLTKGKVPLIGVGGVFSGADAYAKIRAGASLVQLYTAMVYEGVGVVNHIAMELSNLLERDGFSSVAEAVGANHA